MRGVNQVKQKRDKSILWNKRVSPIGFDFIQKWNKIEDQEIFFSLNEII